jgi:hypothetical protein
MILREPVVRLVAVEMTLRSGRITLLSNFVILQISPV